MPQRNSTAQGAGTTATPTLGYDFDKYTAHQIQITGMGSNTCAVKVKGSADQLTTAATVTNDDILNIEGVYRGISFEFSGTGSATIWITSYNLDEIDGG